MATAKKTAATKKATPRARVNVRPEAPPPPPAAPQATEPEEQPAEKEMESVAVPRAGHVTVEVPVSFTLTRDDHTKVQVPKGVMTMPLADAEHWYSKAHGVKIRTDL